jgi:hypothetical protein
MIVYDLLLDVDGDLLIESGDLVMNDSNQELLNSLMLSHFGEWKLNPGAGLNIESYLNGDITQRLILEQNLRSLMKGDGFVLQDLNISANNLNELEIKSNADRSY